MTSGETGGFACDLHGSLSTDTLELLGPVGSLGLADDGKTLKGVRLERAGHIAHGSHDRELPGLLALGGSTGGTDGSSSNDWRHCVIWNGKWCVYESKSGCE